jgi:hypothetical protein
LIGYKNKRNVLYGLIIILAGGMYFPAQAQQKKGTQRANFSGEWKAKESISMGGNIVCVYADSDRMRYNTMKIAQQADCLTIEVPNQSPEAAQPTNREKLVFNGKAREIDYGWARGKNFTVKLSADGQTMTVNSIVHLMVRDPGPINAKKQEFVNVTEVWKLSNDGKSITVQTNAKSVIVGEERSWITVFAKAG